MRSQSTATFPAELRGFRRFLWLGRYRFELSLPQDPRRTLSSLTGRLSARISHSQSEEVYDPDLLKRARIESRSLVDQPLRRLTHAVAAEDGLDLVAVHPIADPDPDAAIPEGHAAAVNLEDVERGSRRLSGSGQQP